MATTKKSQDDLKQELVALRKRVAGPEAARAEHHQLEVALRASEERHRVINESAFDYAFSFRLNDQGVFFLEWLTNNFTQITGYAAEKLIGKQTQSATAVYPSGGSTTRYSDDSNADSTAADGV